MMVERGREDDVSTARGCCWWIFLTPPLLSVTQSHLEWATNATLSRGPEQQCWHGIVTESDFPLPGFELHLLGLEVEWLWEIGLHV